MFGRTAPASPPPHTHTLGATHVCQNFYEVIVDKNLTEHGGHLASHFDPVGIEPANFFEQGPKIC